MSYQNEMEVRDGLTLIHYDAVVIRNDEPKLAHHGIKGQKWGVRNGPPYPIDRKKVEKTKKSGIVKSIVEGHKGISPRGVPNSICDHVDDGKVDKRAFYDENGWKKKEIHTNDHGNPKHHPYGQHGEHIHTYEWNHETGKQLGNKVEEISEHIRKENKDIL